MGFLDQLNKPGTSGRPGYLGNEAQKTSYRLQLLGLRSKASEDKNRPRGTDVVTAEFLISASNDPAIKVGETRAFVAIIEPNDKGDKAIADVKCLLFALLGTDPQNKPAVEAFEASLTSKGHTVAALFEHATGANNPLAGRFVACGCEVVKTKSGGKFTRHTFTPDAPAAPAAGG